MLHIYTSIEQAESKGYKVIEDIDAMFDLRLDSLGAEAYTDETSEFILKSIEGMTDRMGNVIVGRFGPVGIQNISTGGKGCLLATNYTDFIIAADLLGSNCIKLLLSLDKDITVVYRQLMHEIKEDDTVTVDDELLKGYAARSKLTDAYYLNYVIPELDELEEDYEESDF